MKHACSRHIPFCALLLGCYQVPIAELGGYRSWAVESFGSEQYPGIKQGNHNDAHSDEDPGREDELEAREKPPVAPKLILKYACFVERYGV